MAWEWWLLGGFGFAFIMAMGSTLTGKFSPKLILGLLLLGAVIYYFVSFVQSGSKRDFVTRSALIGSGGVVVLIVLYSVYKLF